MRRALFWVAIFPTAAHVSWADAERARIAGYAAHALTKGSMRPPRRN